MFETDKNMIKAIDFLKESGNIDYKTEAYGVMGLDTSRIYRIQHPEKFKQGHHFSAEDIRVFCDHFKINSNFIFGFENVMYRK